MIKYLARYILRYGEKLDICNYRIIIAKNKIEGMELAEKLCKCHNHWHWKQRDNLYWTFVGINKLKDEAPETKGSIEWMYDKIK